MYIFYFNQISLNIYSLWSNWWKLNIVWGNGLVPLRHQAIASINVDHDLWYHMASLGPNELMTLRNQRTNGSNMKTDLDVEITYRILGVSRSSLCHAPHTSTSTYNCTTLSSSHQPDNLTLFCPNLFWPHSSLSRIMYYTVIIISLHYDSLRAIFLFRYLPYLITSFMSNFSNPSMN